MRLTCCIAATLLSCAYSLPGNWFLPRGNGSPVSSCTSLLEMVPAAVSSCTSSTSSSCTVGFVTMTSVQIVQDQVTASVTVTNVTMPGPVLVTDLTSVLQTFTPPPIVSVQTALLPPPSTIVLTETSTVFETFFQTMTEMQTLPAETSTVLLETQIVVTQLPLPVIVTEFVTQPAPEMTITDTMGQTLTQLFTVTVPVTAPPVMITSTEQVMLTLTAPPEIVTVTELITLPPVINTVFETLTQTITITSTAEETLLFTMTTVVPETLTETVFVTQVSTETMTMTPPPVATTDMVMTTLQSEELTTITRTLTAIQTITETMGFTITSVIPTVVTVTEMKAMSFVKMEHPHNMYGCTCPTLSCPPPVICTPTAVTLTITKLPAKEAQTKPTICTSAATARIPAQFNYAYANYQEGQI